MSFCEATDTPVIRDKSKIPCRRGNHPPPPSPGGINIQFYQNFRKTAWNWEHFGRYGAPIPIPIPLHALSPVHKWIPQIHLWCDTCWPLMASIAAEQFYPRNCAVATNFSQKLHEIERIWTPRGHPKFHYVDPPLLRTSIGDGSSPGSILFLCTMSIALWIWSLLISQ